jgi:hypothetical protein
MGVLNGQDVAKGFTQGEGQATRAKVPSQHGVRRARDGRRGLGGRRRDG